jgi:hypothetical protein
MEEERTTTARRLVAPGEKAAAVATMASRMTKDIMVRMLRRGSIRVKNEEGTKGFFVVDTTGRGVTKRARDSLSVVTVL